MWTVAAAVVALLLLLLIGAMGVANRVRCYEVQLANDFLYSKEHVPHDPTSIPFPEAPRDAESARKLTKGRQIHKEPWPSTDKTCFVSFRPPVWCFRPQRHHHP